MTEQGMTEKGMTEKGTIHLLNESRVIPVSYACRSVCVPQEACGVDCLVLALLR